MKDALARTNGGSDPSGRELRRQQAIGEYALAARPVLNDLHKAGLSGSSIMDVARLRGREYKRFAAILLHWLALVDNKDVKESIVRALTMKEARPEAAPALIREFEATTGELDLKWAIGNALSVVADDSVFDDIVRLAREKRHGRAREMVAFALGNMKNPQAVDVLSELLDDEEVAGHALIPLGKLRAAKARSRVEAFVTHPKAWVRREATRALAKIDKAEARKEEAR